MNEESIIVMWIGSIVIFCIWMNEIVNKLNTIIELLK